MRYLRNIQEFIVEKVSVDFNTFPKDILDTLNDEYGHYFKHNFDWNDKQDEFAEDSVGFKNWLKENEKQEFLKNLDTIITKTREDLIHLKRKELAEKTLKDFEELIKPTLGNEVLCEPLSKYAEIALLNLHDPKEIEKAFKDAKNIIETDGTLNQSKISPSEVFTGGDINLPQFERFVEKNPEYKGVFNDWKKMFDREMQLSIKDMNAFRNSTPYNKIKKLYDFLVDFRK